MPESRSISKLAKINWLSVSLLLDLPQYWVCWPSSVLHKSVTWCQYLTTSVSAQTVVAWKSLEVCGRYLQTSHSDYSSQLLWSCSKLEDHHSLGLRKKHLAESTYTPMHWIKTERKRKREGDCDRQEQNEKLNSRKWNIFIRVKERAMPCPGHCRGPVIPILMNVDHQPSSILVQKLQSHRDLWTQLM